MRKFRRSVTGIVLCSLSVMMLPTCLAGVTLTGTRIVFTAGLQEKVVRTSNKGSQPALVQVWIDDGTTAIDGANQDTPFMAIPPLFRIEPGKGQSVRVRYLGQPLPTDKESVFWFNLLEIPPSNLADKDVDQLSLAFRTRIKLFYRPKGLTSNGADQASKLRWQQHRPGQLKLFNDSPYFISFQSVELSLSGSKKEVMVPMIAPFAEQEISLPDELKKHSITQINYEVINDYGNGISFIQNKTQGGEFSLVQ